MELKQNIITNWNLLRQKVFIKKLFKLIFNHLIDIVQQKDDFSKY